MESVVIQYCIVGFCYIGMMENEMETSRRFPGAWLLEGNYMVFKV